MVAPQCKQKSRSLMGLQPSGSKHNQVNTIPNSNNFKSMVKKSVTSNTHGKAVSQSLKGTGNNHHPSFQFPIPAAETTHSASLL